MDYSTYKLSIKEYILGGCIYTTIACLLSYLFYNSALPLVVLLPCVGIFYKHMSKYLLRKKQDAMIMQFKDLLISIGSLLSTGHSLENTISIAKNEIFNLYGKCIIYDELALMEKRLRLNIPIETIFSDFAGRSNLDAIHTFSQILSITKQTGGDLKGIILSTTSAISSQIDIRMDIATQIAGQKFEVYIMATMPPAIMIYIKLTNSGFFTPVYHNILGVIVMTFCLILYVSSVILAYKIISSTK